MSAKGETKLQTAIPTSLHKRVKIAALMKDMETKEFIASALETACDAAQSPNQAAKQRRTKAA